MSKAGGGYSIFLHDATWYDLMNECESCPTDPSMHVSANACSESIDLMVMWGPPDDPEGMNILRIPWNQLAALVLRFGKAIQPGNLAQVADAIKAEESKAVNDEKLIKVHLPGESLWAEVVGTTDNGRTKAVLRNASVHGIPWGTEVLIGADGYEIVGPPEVLEQAQRSVDAVQSEES